MSGQKAPVKITAEMIAESLVDQRKSSNATNNANSTRSVQFDQNDALAHLIVQQQTMMKMMKKMIKQQADEQVEQQQLAYQTNENYSAAGLLKNCVDQAKTGFDTLIAWTRFISCNPALWISSIESRTAANEEFDLELGLGADNY